MCIFCLEILRYLCIQLLKSAAQPMTNMNPALVWRHLKQGRLWRTLARGEASAALTPAWWGQAGVGQAGDTSLVVSVRPRLHQQLSVLLHARWACGEAAGSAAEQ